MHLSGFQKQHSFLVNQMIEIFSRETLEKMESVEKSRSSSFDELIIVSGLDPSSDLRHASLRGVDLRGCDLSCFDLTGCDVDGALISATTKLPPAEKMTDLKGAWIISPDVHSIVELMRAIEISDPSQRNELLRSLIEEYDSDRHIDLFLLNSVRKTRATEFAVDLFECMSPDFVLENSIAIRQEIKRLLLLDEKKAQPRRKVGARDRYSFVSRLIGWLADSDVEVAADAADEYRSGQLTLGRFIDHL